MSTLEIKDLHVTVETDQGTKEILRGVTLTIESGQTHAIMGPNGSGKSTLAYSVAGHPKYTITSGTVTLDGEDVLAMSVDERARAGLFLAMQYPVEVPGVTVSNFLRTAKTAVDGEAPKLRTWVKDVKEAMADLRMDLEARRAWIGEQPLEVSSREWAVLEYLLSRVGHVVGKEQILQAISGWDDALSENAVEVYVSRLRPKIEPAGLRIRAVRGFGYLVEEVPGGAPASARA